MKQKFNNIVLIILSSIVFFVGAGVTVFSFCCSSCVNNIASLEDLNHNLCAESMDIKAEKSCCDEQKASENESVCADHADHDEDRHCNAERISVDIEHSHVTTQLNIPFVWSFIVYSLSVSNFDLISSDKFGEYYKTPESLPPRDYLALIRILII